MPVMDRNSSGHTNGDPSGEPTKEFNQPKPIQGVLIQEPANQVCDLLDLLGDSNSPVLATNDHISTAPNSTNSTSSNVPDSLLDLLGGLEPTPAPNVTVYEKGGLNLKLKCDQQTETSTTVTFTASNSTQSDITGFTIQAAVPKSVQLQMKAPSGDVVPAQGCGTVTQTILLNYTNKANLKMRVRLSYSSQGTVCQEMVQIDSFPSPAWS